MASILQKRLSRAGLSRQSAKGTAASAATYGYGVDGGSIFKLDLQEDEIGLTWSNLDILGYDRKGVKPSQDVGSIATANLIGLYLLGALGADTVTGSASPYTHTITPASVLPYLTAWGAFGTADFAQIIDSKVSSLELTWEQAGKLQTKAMIPGITPAFLASQYTETNLEVPSSVGYFTAGGGTFTIEGTTALITGGTIKIDNHIAQPIVSSTVLPADVVEGKREITWSLKILPTDTHLFREVYFGAGTAGALSGMSPYPHYGAISAVFTGPTVGGSATSLTLSSSTVRFMVEFPESGPDGGPAELTLAGTSILPSSGASLTATLTNGVSGY